MSKTETDKLTINQKLARLDADIEWFYGEDFNLDEATEHYKSAIKLAKDVETDLKNLQNEIEVLTTDFTKS